MTTPEPANKLLHPMLSGAAVVGASKVIDKENIGLDEPTLKRFGTQAVCSMFAPKISTMPSIAGNVPTAINHMMLTSAITGIGYSTANKYLWNSSRSWLRDFMFSAGSELAIQYIGY